MKLKVILAVGFSIWLLGLQGAVYVFAGALLGTVLGIVLIYLHDQFPIEKIKHWFFARSRSKD